MKRDVPFTALLLIICFGCFASFWLVTTQHAADIDCTPDSFNHGETYVGCPNLYKKAHWSVVFPGAQYTMYPEGKGQCNYGHPCCDSTLGLKTIELDYKEAKKLDEYGNYFRYRAKVKDEQDVQVSRWAWDVFLVSR